MIKKEENKWLIDSGTSSHMTNKKDLLKNYKAMDETENVVLADRRVVKARGCGNVTLGARGMARCFRL